MDKNKLFEDAEVGQQVARALDISAVQSYFDRSESNIIDALLNTPAGDKGHADREGLVCQLRAIRQLHNSLKKTVAEGKSAESILSASAPDD
tara:strand:+ start:289 stop:564 length:276 start_codon:yes stop_codon:yes gene_type:complete